MILSVSRRTDIPAFYSEWFLNRLKAGYLLIPNPRNKTRLSRIELSPDIVDCIVFWTKNATPMLDKLLEIEKMGYLFYFQFTITPYSEAIECNLPKKTYSIQSFKNLSKRIGTDCTIWRYDPVIVDNKHTIDWHLNQFYNFAEQLNPFTKRCVISFVDPYKHIGKSYKNVNNLEMLKIAEGFSITAKKFGITLYTCAEEINLEQFGIHHSSCIDQKLIEQIIGTQITSKKDSNQRLTCGCIESVDIGAYDTCANGCLYCYAVSNQIHALHCAKFHDPNAPMITGYPTGNEIITNRTVQSQKENQLRLF